MWHGDARVAKLATWRPFNQYLRDRGVEAARCRVCLDEKGLGLVAATRLARGETAARVPSSAWRPLAAETALAHARRAAPQFVERVARAGGGERAGGAGGAERLLASVSLMVHALQLLAHEPAPGGGGGGDPAAACLAFLREAGSLGAAHPPPLLWPERALDELRGTSAHEPVARRRRYWREVHAAVFGGGGGGGPSAAQLRLGATLVTSRAMSGVGPLALVPLIDLANHSPSPNAALGFDGDAFTLAATADVAAGAELLVDYGARPNAALLQLYGFALDDNRADALALGDGGGRGLARDDARSGGVRLPDELERGLDALARGGDEGVRVDTLAAARGFRDACRRQAGAFPETLESDERALAHDEMPTWRRHALRVRVGELRLLEGAIGRIDAALTRAEPYSVN